MSGAAKAPITEHAIYPALRAAGFPSSSVRENLANPPELLAATLSEGSDDLVHGMLAALARDVAILGAAVGAGSEEVPLTSEVRDALRGLEYRARCAAEAYDRMIAKLPRVACSEDPS